MTYSNVTIYDDQEERKRRALAEAERKFWADEASRLQLVLENIPQAVRQYGYVTIQGRGGDKLTLIAKPEEGEVES